MGSEGSFGVNRFYHLMLAVILALSGLGSGLPKAGEGRTSTAKVAEAKVTSEAPAEVCNCGCGMMNCCCSHSARPSTTQQNQSPSNSKAPTSQTTASNPWGMPSKGWLASLVKGSHQESRPWVGLFRVSLRHQDGAGAVARMLQADFLNRPLKAPGCCLERLTRLHIFRI